MTEQLFGNKVDLIQVSVFSSRADMGAAAGKDVADCIRLLHGQQEIVRMVFAAAPSQAELLSYLAADTSIDWKRIDVFHMDEYIGLPPEAPQRFGFFLMEHLFKKVKPRRIHLINDSAELQETCMVYEKLLKEFPIDIVCLGVGENGHLAFNDPPVADFDDRETIKPVVLDQACRQQQVNDGCFTSLNNVPLQALTLTIPALLSATYLFCVVPGKTKSVAVKNLLEGNIAAACPASILRTHNNCRLYVDMDSYSLVTAKHS